MTEHRAAKKPAENRFPSQARYILGNEAAERYSYYGMKGILALYIINVLIMSQDDATLIIHLFSFANYFMPILGAWVSDRYWGRYKTILWISLSYCAGHAVLAMSDAFQTVDAKTICLYVGLGLIAFGSGGIKPCVSAFMGDQFGPERRHLLPKAYAAFYWAINLGSTAAFLTIPYIRKEWGYSWAFGVPGIAMGLATFVFWLGTKHYIMVPPSAKTKSAGFFKVFFHALTHGDERQPGESFWAPAKRRFKPEEVDAAASVGPILMVFALAPVFWALFDQTFSTWVMQGEQMRPVYIGQAAFKPADIADPVRMVQQFQSDTNVFARRLWERLPEAERASLVAVTNEPAAAQKALAATLNRLARSELLYQTNWFGTNGPALSAETKLILKHQPEGPELLRANRLLIEDGFPEVVRKSYRIGPEEMLSANPIFVMIFVPILSVLVYPRLGRFATPLKRMSSGMFLAAGTYLIVAWLQVRIDHGEELTILWQILPYVVLTIAEVLFSTTGLEFAFREAAPSMKSIIMGFWTLTVAVGNLLVTGITAVAGHFTGGSGHDVSVTPQMFLFYAGLTFVVAIAFSILASFYRYRDPEAAQGR
jgi:dipeptide/tripeptide permease